jgi:lysophospholipase L1-like esterase
VSESSGVCAATSSSAPFQRASCAAALYDACIVTSNDASAGSSTRSRQCKWCRFPSRSRAVHCPLSTAMVTVPCPLGASTSRVKCAEIVDDSLNIRNPNTASGRDPAVRTSAACVAIQAHANATQSASRRPRDGGGIEGARMAREGRAKPGDVETKFALFTRTCHDRCVVRVCFILAGTLLLSAQTACGDSVPSHARLPAASDTTNAAHPAGPGAPPSDVATVEESTRAPVVAAVTRVDDGRGVIASLENAPALKHFYDALERIDAGQSHDDAVILQFGDSHTAADYETGPLRRALQARFGDGGRGFVAIGNPWKHYVQEGARNGNTSDWSGERGKPTKHGFVGDGMYGLDGFSIHASRPGARAWGEYASKATRLELAYLAQPHGGAFDVMVDGARAAHISSRAASPTSAWRAFDVSEGPHRVEVVASGDGDVRLFGTILDRDQVGITLDALGINGARVTNALTWDEGHMAEQIRHRDPDLVVFAYGTNESGDTDVPIETYERQLVDLLGRVARAAPSASCLLLGPPDRAVHTRDGWATVARLLDIVATQRRVASAAGCAFFDQLEAMGGPGTIAQWADEAQPRANRDRVHLTREGYAQLAGALSTELIRGYEDWRSQQGAAPAGSSVAISETSF